jgi:hypothetical protein
MYSYQTDDGRELMTLSRSLVDDPLPVILALITACQNVWNEWHDHARINDPAWQGYETMQKVKAAIKAATGKEPQ